MTELYIVDSMCIPKDFIDVTGILIISFCLLSVFGAQVTTLIEE